jgi:hypothetical protein
MDELSLVVNIGRLRAGVLGQVSRYVHAARYVETYSDLAGLPNLL